RPRRRDVRGRAAAPHLAPGERRVQVAAGDSGTVARRPRPARRGQRGRRVTLDLARLQELRGWNGVHAARRRIDASTREAGRLRRKMKPDPSLASCTDRLAGHVETLDIMLSLSAAELYPLFLVECGDDQVALEESLAVVDARAVELRR